MLFVLSFLHLCKHLSFWYCQHLIAMSLSYKERKKPNRSKLGMLINLAPESQRSWVRFLFKSEFFQVSSFQPLRLKHLHCDDLHLILHLCFHTVRGAPPALLCIAFLWIATKAKIVFNCWHELGCTGPYTLYGQSDMGQPYWAKCLKQNHASEQLILIQN